MTKQKPPDEEAIDLVAKARALSNQFEKDYRVWEFFSGRVDDVKARLWSTMTWLVGLQVAFASYLHLKEVFFFVHDEIQTHHPKTLIASSVLGIIFGVYSFIAVYIHHDHLRRAQAREEEALNKIKSDSIKHKIKIKDYISVSTIIPYTISIGLIVFYIVILYKAKPVP